MSEPYFSPDRPIAYFCAEYGLETKLPLYAGGLGVLAGDTLKAAADARIPMVAVGLLYRGTGAHQRITSDGTPEAYDEPFDPLSAGIEHVYVDEMPLFIRVHLTQVDVWVRVWKKQIGQTVTLYLLDTDTDQNQVSERTIAAALYAGTHEELIKQQLILGIGGVKLLRNLGIHPSLYHVNEGRPCFLHWELVKHMMEHHQLSYQDAREHAKQHTVYTNHTLVGAGNQSFDTNLLKVYGKYYADAMGITVDELLAPGVVTDTGGFSITRYALNTSRKASAVSQLHGKLCKEHWPEFSWESITNGVHLPTWQDERLWGDALARLSDHDLWKIHQDNKEKLASFVQQRTGFGFDPNKMVITWARRVTGYKQLETLFSDVKHLRGLLANADRPVQLLISGKAHVYDDVAQQLIRTIIQTMSSELSGCALYIPDYDLDVARHLTRGSDVWLNTPQIGQEASGTSGMKAVANGVLQCTVADGWAAEVDWKDKGWVLDHIHVARTLYQYLEKEMIPMYYDRDVDGLSTSWLARMRASISLSGAYSAERMAKEYAERLYG